MAITKNLPNGVITTRSWLLIMSSLETNHNDYIVLQKITYSKTNILIIYVFLGLSPNPVIKPVAAPASHSILKNGNIPQSSYVPPYTVQSPYSTMVWLKQFSNSLLKLLCKPFQYWTLDHKTSSVL